MPSVLIQKMKNRKLQAGRIILNLLCYLVECGTQFGFQHHSHHTVAALNLGTDIGLIFITKRNGIGEPLPAAGDIATVLYGVRSAYCSVSCIKPATLNEQVLPSVWKPSTCGGSSRWKLLKSQAKLYSLSAPH